jgi:hypothetical protein
VGLPFRPAYAANDVALQAAQATADIGFAISAGADPEVKVPVWRRPEPSAPLRAMLPLSATALTNSH